MTTFSTASTKKTIVTSSNLAILALVASSVAANWSWGSFQLFLRTKLKQVWPCLLLTEPVFLLIMPLLPKPCTNNNNNNNNIEVAAKPSIGEAKFMALATSLIDYLVVGGLLLFWDSVCRLEDGSLCPFTAAGTLLVGTAAIFIKDEVQCRFLWRKFISPYKVNSWPYSWRRSFDCLCGSVPLTLLSYLGLILSGWVSHESIKNPKVLLQVQLESMLVADGITNIFLMFGHKWLHQKAFFLHKKHHKAGNKCLMAFGASAFDLLDMMIEFGGGVPCLLVIKTLIFGPASRVHFLTPALVMLKGDQGHSGNPYAPYFFVPFLDYLVRGPLCHNLHHVIQSEYHSSIPHHHLSNQDSRKKDIDLYNKHMKTQFPRSV